MSDPAPPPGHRVFPAGFLWGAATAAYQIEGAHDVDGRAPSIWDTFARRPGAVAGGDNGDLACDHYRRWRDDLDLLTELGLTGYRFSVAWPRVVPDGRGRVNTRGLDFYDQIVDRLLELGVTPMLTLYHWDLPEALQRDGGWTNRSTVDAFVDYADAVSRRLADRVPMWITLNEPWVATVIGHALGQHAPGLTDWTSALSAAHHMLLAHGHAVSVLRGNGASQVGLTNLVQPYEPAGPSPADADAARRGHELMNEWFCQPVFAGSYPPYLRGWLADRGYAPPERDGDLDAMRQPLDFLGVNYYYRVVVRHDPDGYGPLEMSPVRPDGPRTAMGWEVHPPSLTKTLTWLTDTYRPRAVYITESGAAYPDVVDGDGRIRDAERVAYTRDHLAAAHRALELGVPLRGHFAWSLLDNFEWAEGYDKRFGLVHVDYRDQSRRIKDSGRAYAAIAAANAVGPV